MLTLGASSAFDARREAIRTPTQHPGRSLRDLQRIARSSSQQRKAGVPAIIEIDPIGVGLLDGRISFALAVRLEAFQVLLPLSGERVPKKRRLKLRELSRTLSC